MQPGSKTRGGIALFNFHNHDFFILSQILKLNGFIPINFVLGKLSISDQYNTFLFRLFHFLTWYIEDSIFIVTDQIYWIFP
jgi:hypothetical protein